MRDKQRYHQLCEESWRRPLTPPEEAELRAWLAAHPGQESDWETEAALTRVLQGLPDVEVSSNFTARTVQAAQRKRAADHRRRWSWGRLRQLGWRVLPRAAFAAFMACAGILFYAQVQSTQRERMVESVSTVAQVAALPGAELLQDFDAIRALNPAPGADEELLRLLQ